LGNVVWQPFEEEQWQRIQVGNDASLFNQAFGLLGQFDGFWDVVNEHALLPAGVTLEQLKQCVYCNEDPQLDSTFLSALETNVVQPVRLVQDLIKAHPQITRLYTTMSAAEMTVDPVFTFNPDLRAVSNIHTAERVIECSAGYYQEEAPWRIELPQGGVIRGTPSDVGNWPTSFASQPANRLITRQGESGDGKVLEDNTDEIRTEVANYRASVKAPPKHTTSSDSFGCSVSRGPGSGSWLFASLGLMLSLGRRRRR
jgi:MYXO-CTERM domain-containing protein